jgi:hypothetical protein
VAEGAHAGVHAVGVGGNQRARVRPLPCQHALGAGAEAVQAALAVDVQRRRADQAAEFAGAGAAQQVHFEEAFLAVQEAERACQIEPVGGGDGGHAGGVAIHLHGGGEALDARRAVEHGTAGAKHPGGAEAGGCEHGEAREA